MTSHTDGVPSHRPVRAPARLPREWVVVLALALAPMATTGIGRFAYSLILPAMRADLSWTYTQAGWMNTANGLGYLLGAIVSVRLARTIDPRRTFSAGLLLTALALAASGLVREFELLVGLRVVTGMASALAFISGGTLAAHAGPQRFAPTAIAVYVGGAGFGILISAAALPALMAHHGDGAWGQAWLVMGTLAFAAAIPSVLAAAGVSVPVDRVAATSWSRRRFVPSLCAHLLHGVGSIAYLTFVIAWMKGRGSSALELSLVWAVVGIGIMVGPFLWARPLRDWRGGAPQAAAIAVLALGAALPLVSGTLAAMVSSAALIGAAVMIPPASAMALARRCLPPSAVNSAMATTTVLFAAGQCIGPALAGAIVDASGSLAGGLAFAAVVLALGAFTCLHQKEVPCHSHAR